jgi:hypothetical protein
MKTVGRRKFESGVLSDIAVLQTTVAALRPVDELVPRGVYRFKTFEEAERWMIATIAATLAHRKSKTSSGSAAR